MARLSDIIEGMERSSRPKTLARTGRYVKAISVNDDPMIDPGRMTASARICTDVVDYQQEVIIAGEVDLTNYAKNGVVLYEHGDNISFDHPLGTSIAPSGKLDVTLVDDFNMDATCYFADVAKQFPIVNQYFGLIDAGVIRATSIHVQPRHDGKRTYKGKDGNEIVVTEASDMVEWSWCKMGVNPEALKKSFASRNRLSHAFAERFVGAVSLQADRAAFVLASGKINNEILRPSIRKSLLSIVRTSTNGNGIGHSFSEKTMKLKSLTNSQLKALSGDELEEMHDEDQFKCYEKGTEGKLKSLYSELMDEEEGGKEDEDEPDEDSEGKSYDSDFEESDYDSESEKKAKRLARRKSEMFDEEDDMDSEAKAKQRARRKSEMADEDDMDPDAKAKRRARRKSEMAEEDDMDPEAKAKRRARRKSEMAEEDEMAGPVMKAGKAGSSALRQIYEGLNLLLDAAEQALDPVEQPDVKGGMEELMSQARGMSAAIDGLHETAYGEALEGKAEASAEEQKKQMEDEDTVQSQMKAFLAGPRQVPRFQMKGFAGQLRRIASNKSIPRGLRKSLSNMSDGIENLQEEATDAMTKGGGMVSQSEFDELMESYNELEATLARANATIEQLMSAS